MIYVNQSWHIVKLMSEASFTNRAKLNQNLVDAMDK